jgi:hypothetical protein
MRWCVRCENCRWVCENHLDRPWEGLHACACGGAGAPCPICNPTDELSAPEMPEGFQPDVVNKDWKAVIGDTRIPRYTGRDLGDVAQTEADHHMKCPACGRWFDMRDLGALFDHAGPLPHPAANKAQ